MSALNALLEENFLVCTTSISTAEGLNDFLGVSPEVQSLRKAIFAEEVGAAEIEQFIRELLMELKPGQRFSKDVVLAAIAVALLPFPTEFGSGFIGELSALQVREIPMAPRVALIIKKIREKNLPQRTQGRFNLEGFNLPVDVPVLIVSTARLPSYAVSKSFNGVALGTEYYPAPYLNNMGSYIYNDNNTIEELRYGT